MRYVKSISVHCETNYNNESKYTTKTTILLTCNDDINEKNTYNESNILKNEKCINQHSTNTENHAKVEILDVYLRQ